MPSKMYDLGYEYESCCSSPASEKPDSKKKRKDYPCLYVRGKDLPEMEVDKDGYGIATIKFRVQGYRSPAEGEKSIELEVHELSESTPANGSSKGSKDAGDMLEEEFSKTGSEENDEAEAE